MADPIDIRTRRGLSKRSVAEIVTFAARRATARTYPYGLRFDGGHCRQCTTVKEIHRAIVDGYSMDKAGSTPDFVLMVRPV